MNFDLSDDQLLLEETVSRMLGATCPLTRVHEIVDSPSGIDPKLWQELGSLGVLGLAISQEHGGSGGSLLDLAVVAEVLGRGAAPGPFLEHVLGAMAVDLAGDDEQRRRWLPKLATGEARATIALLESSTDRDGWRPEAWTLDPSGWSGQKWYVPYAQGADLVVVGTAGGGLAIVEPAEDVVVEPLHGLDLTRRLDRLTFHAARCEPLPGGAEHADALVDAALVLLAADAYGGAEACLHASVRHAREREQFGVPIGTFQALQHQLADMALDVLPARGLVWLAAHAWDHLDRRAAASSAANAKAHVTDRYVAAARLATEVHGGLGYTWESDTHLWLKRARFDWALFGDAPHHRRRLVDLEGWARGPRAA